MVINEPDLVKLVRQKEIEIHPDDEEMNPEYDFNNDLVENNEVPGNLIPVKEIELVTKTLPEISTVNSAMIIPQFLFRTGSFRPKKKQNVSEYVWSSGITRWRTFTDVSSTSESPFFLHQQEEKENSESYNIPNHLLVHRSSFYRSTDDLRCTNSQQKSQFLKEFFIASASAILPKSVSRSLINLANNRKDNSPRSSETWKKKSLSKFDGPNIWYQNNIEEDEKNNISEKKFELSVPEFEHSRSMSPVLRRNKLPIEKEVKSDTEKRTKRRSSCLPTVPESPLTFKPKSKDVLRRGSVAFSFFNGTTDEKHKSAVGDGFDCCAKKIGLPRNGKRYDSILGISNLKKNEQRRSLMGRIGVNKTFWV